MNYMMMTASKLKSHFPYNNSAWISALLIAFTGIALGRAHQLDDFPKKGVVLCLRLLVGFFSLPH